MSSSALIRSETLDGWSEFLTNRGLDFDTLSKGLSQTQRQTPSGHDAIALSEFVQIIEHVCSQSAVPGLAWNVGDAADYSTRGAVGRSVLSSKTLATAFRRLTTYFPLLQEATDLKLTIGEDWSTLSYRILDPDIWPRHHDAMYSLGIYSSLVKKAAPDAWSQTEITLEATAEQVDCNFSSIIQTNCIYGGDTNALRFPTRALSSKLELAPKFNADQDKLTKELVRLRRTTPILDRVRHIIFRELNEGCVGQEYISKELGMTSRTLRRKLSAENLSFQAILDDCRMRAAALEFRTQKSVSLSETALRLGYSEHSTFSRAFARWAGMPPQDYRRALLLN